jgi:tetratricopeptide (TPR) repeat protein
MALVGAAAWVLIGLPPAPAAGPASAPGGAGLPPASDSKAGSGKEAANKSELATPPERTDVPTLAPPKRGPLRSASAGPSPAETSPAAGTSATGNLPTSLASPPPTQSSTTLVRTVPTSKPDAAPGPAADRGTAEPGAKPPAQSGDTPLRPIPEGAPPGPVEIETASFNKVTPGVSTLEDVQKSWGAPKQVGSRGGMAVHLYKIEPFEHVEAFFSQGKVASIVIRLSRAFPADGVARQLALSNIRPVLVSNAMGEILGQSYPERGVLFSFEPAAAPGKVTMNVAQIILEPVTAEPFLLRAETNLDAQPEACLRDLDQALKLSPQNGRAHWLRAKLLVLTGDPAKALAAADEAVRLGPRDAQYRVTRAQILGQLGRFPEAIQDAERAIADSGQRAHVKARAQCLLGDLLGSGLQPDFKRAIQYHTLAIKTATELKTSPHPAIRVPAKEVLLDAHLGAAHDIAWGNWNQKETAVRMWLQRAAALADDLIEKEGGTVEQRFRVAARALAACVGVQGKLDPTEWTEKVLQAGQELIAAVGNTPQRQQVQWELGMALYDAVQVYQMRSQRDQAAKYGQRAVEFLEAGRATKDNPMDAYLLGRLYFRLGSIQAIGQQEHKAAVAWFDKAVPVLQQAADRLPAMESGRLGETFVSMGVSYWETGQKEGAIKLTQQGVELMEKAVAGGGLQQSALDVPYTNLATMHRQLGQEALAEKYMQKAAAQKNGTLRR